MTDMSRKYALAIDMGASSGRHILGYIDGGRLKLEEVYRFDNGFKNENGALVWDTEHLLCEIKNGLKKCAEIGKIPEAVAIDTWGVDYVLLDGEGKELLPCHCYRDGRTEASMPEAERIISHNELYSRTGLGRQAYNTVYQLYADKLSGKLAMARSFLMMPAYFSYKLTGVMKNEYTLATTTGLVNAQSRTWDKEIIEKLGYPPELFGELSQPSELVGDFTEEMQSFCGYNAKVIFAPSHDTASAVASCPMGENDLFISSGTWSLMGMELSQAVLCDKARDAGFSNEGGVKSSYRFLKNYMGMWLLQSIRRDIGKSLSYDEMMHMAEGETNYSYFDVNHKSLVAPENMTDAIRAYFGRMDMPLSEVLASVYHSLARSYKTALDEIEDITGIAVGAIHIVGGGCQDQYLNRLTAEYTGKDVTAGPVEATAMGNVMAQFIYMGEYRSFDDARRSAMEAFDF